MARLSFSDRTERRATWSSTKMLLSNDIRNHNDAILSSDHDKPGFP